MSIAPKVGILIHGCHLQADQWEEIVFWKDDQLGRVPVALIEAVKRNAGLIFWGTGASAKDEVKESVYTYNQALGPKLDELAKRVNTSSELLLKYVKKVSFIDTITKNTTEEIQAAANKCKEMGIEELLLVSSPTHIARCMQEACKFRAKDKDCKVTFYARASDTCFACSTPFDVVIIEPPHRGDRQKISFYQTVRKFFFDWFPFFASC